MIKHRITVDGEVYAFEWVDPMGVWHWVYADADTDDPKWIARGQAFTVDLLGDSNKPIIVSRERFTGALDSHNKEVYEGDVIMWNNMIHVVIYHSLLNAFRLLTIAHVYRHDDSAEWEALWIPGKHLSLYPQGHLTFWSQQKGPLEKVGTRHDDQWLKVNDYLNS